MKNKMSSETKIKLIYCGELLIIAVVVLVIGILKLTGVMATRPTRLFIYNIITTAGGLWLIVDLVWCLVSKKRRAKNALLDKIIVIPAAIYLLVFDIICFINKAQAIELSETEPLFINYSVGFILLYIAVIYFFLGIYHYFKPVPQIIEAINEYEEAKRLEELEEQKALDNKEETPQEEAKEEEQSE